MALRFNMFRTPKHRKYDYIPRYYNPDKEELEQKIRMAELKAEDSVEGAKARISSGLRRGKSSKAYKSERKKAMLRSNLMLIFILIILVAGVLYFAEVYLPALMERFE